MSPTFLLGPHHCSPRKPVEGNIPWAEPGKEVSWWHPFLGLSDNTPPAGLGLVGILGPPFLWKEPATLLFFIFEETVMQGVGCPALSNLYPRRTFIHFLISLFFRFHGLRGSRYKWTQYLFLIVTLGRDLIISNIINPPRNGENKKQTTESQNSTHTKLLYDLSFGLSLSINSFHILHSCEKKSYWTFISFSACWQMLFLSEF